jgi:hypothetical protein
MCAIKIYVRFKATDMFKARVASVAAFSWEVLVNPGYWQVTAVCMTDDWKERNGDRRVHALRKCVVTTANVTMLAQFYVKVK